MKDGIHVANAGGLELRFAAFNLYATVYQPFDAVVFVAGDSDRKIASCLFRLQTSSTGRRCPCDNQTRQGARLEEFAARRFHVGVPC